MARLTSTDYYSRIVTKPLSKNMPIQPFHIKGLVIDLSFRDGKYWKDPLILPDQIALRAIRSFNHHVPFDWMIQDT